MVYFLSAASILYNLGQSVLLAVLSSASAGEIMTGF